MEHLIVERKLNEDEKTLLRSTGMKFSMTFDSKKDAKMVYERIKLEMLEGMNSKDKDERKMAKHCKVVLKGKKVIMKGGDAFAEGFTKCIIF